MKLVFYFYFYLSLISLFIGTFSLFLFCFFSHLQIPTLLSEYVVVANGYRTPHIRYLCKYVMYFRVL